jgi:glycine cleavage system H protein
MAENGKKPVDQLPFPDDLLYHREHTWARAQGDLVLVGISSYAQDQLGTIIFFELPAVGDSFTQGQSFGSVESVKVVSTMYMPVSGEVTAVNGALENDPEIANRDPYGAGWIIAVKPSGTTAGLLSGREYAAYLKSSE